MSEDKVAPLLQCCILCDAVTTGPDGKASFIGVFDIFKSRSVPQFNVVLRWCNGRGKFKSKIRILKPDLTDMLPQVENEFELQNRLVIAGGIFGFVNLQFETSGVHWIEVSLENEVVASVPFAVY